MSYDNSSDLIINNNFISNGFRKGVELNNSFRSTFNSNIIVVENWYRV